MDSLPSYDDARLYLGSLCKRGHEWNETKQSLRYKSHRACVECLRERNTRTGGQRRGKLNPEKLYVKEFRARSRRKRRLQEPYTYECLQTRLHEFEGQCAYCGIDVTPCPHCGESRLAWDHFDPAGPDALSNLIPACRWCNTSKNNREFLRWYRVQSFYSKEREQRLLTLLRP